MMEGRGGVHSAQKKSNTGAIIGSLLFAVILWFSVMLANRYFINVRLPLRVMNIPSGLSPSAALPEYISLKIRSTGWRALYFLSQDLHFSASFPDGHSDNSVLSLKAALSENAWFTNDIEVVEIFPAQVITGLEKTVSRYKKIRDDFVFEFKDGEGLANPILFTPDSVLVSGSRKIINEIEYIATERKSFESRSGKWTERVNLVTANGVWVSPQSVDAAFDIQRIVETAVQNVHIKVLDIPESYDVVVIPSQITVGIRGGIDYVGRVKAEDITPVIHYSESASDSMGFVVPEILLPKYIEKVYLEPEKVKIIIKKF